MKCKTLRRLRQSLEVQLLLLRPVLLLSMLEMLLHLQTLMQPVLFSRRV